MKYKVVILLILIIAIIILSCIYDDEYLYKIFYNDQKSNTSSINTIKGGGSRHKNPFKIDLNYDKKCKKIVLDGNNIVHNVYGLKLTKKEFDDGLVKITKNIKRYFPWADIHVVIKNPKNTGVKYIKNMSKLSKNLLNCTLHLAFGTYKNKARDDFLVLYLSNNSYIISNDKFRDHASHENIDKFLHYTFKNGKSISRKIIDPKNHKHKIYENTYPFHYKFKNQENLLIKYKECYPILYIPNKGL